jgi:hypothetical protein
VIGSNNISDAIDKQQQFDSIKQQINGSMDKINAITADLTKQKGDQEGMLTQLSDLKSSQVAQSNSLQQSKTYKNRLMNNDFSALTDLNATEAAANAQVAKIQKQIDALTSTKSWGTQIVSSGGGLAVPTFYQTGDSTPLGSSPYTVGQYGCLVTSFAMVASFYGNYTTPDDIASNDAIFSRDGSLQVSTPPGIGIYTIQNSSVNWGTVDDELANNHPVIISIYLPSVGALNSDGSSHFIVIKGKSGSQYLMNDPIGSGRGYDISQVRSMRIIRSY